MLPRFRTLTLLLALALATTVAVSWACVQWANVAWDTTAAGPAMTKREPAAWPVRPQSDWPAPWNHSSFHGTGLTGHVHDATRIVGRGTWVDFRQVELRSGWPWRAMRTRHASTGGIHLGGFEPYPAPPAPTLPHLSRFQLGITNPDPPAILAWYFPNLPIEPLPLGFALNTLFYFTVFLCLACGASFGRSAWRRRHRRCPSCNYDLSESPGACPECGRPTPRLGKPDVPPEARVPPESSPS